AYGTAPPLADGQRIELEARLERPLGFRNPGTFDHAERLARQGVAVVGTARADRIVAPDTEAPWNARVRRFAVAAMRDALPPTSAALLAGLLLGERTGLPPEVDAAFRRAGVYHVLAVSGFNLVSTIGIVANLAVVPLAGLATILGLVAVPIAALSPLVAGALFAAVWPVLLLLRWTVMLAAAMPGAVVHLPAPGALAIGCYG